MITTSSSTVKDLSRLHVEKLASLFPCLETFCILRSPEKITSFLAWKLWYPKLVRHLFAWDCIPSVWRGCLLPAMQFRLVSISPDISLIFDSERKQQAHSDVALQHIKPILCGIFRLYAAKSESGWSLYEHFWVTFAKIAIAKIPNRKATSVRWWKADLKWISLLYSSHGWERTWLPAHLVWSSHGIFAPGKDLSLPVAILACLASSMETPVWLVWVN